MRSSLWVAAAAAIGLLAPVGAAAKVFHSRDEALSLAFPDADRVDSAVHVLTEQQVERIQHLSRTALDSRLVKLYTGIKNERVLGYAVIDIHNVRTLPEAFMIVLDPQGDVRSLRVLAFHEPLEYQPTDRWYGQFEQKSLAAPLRVGGDIHGVVGATLSARATTRGVRRALAYYEVLVQKER